MTNKSLFSPFSINNHELKNRFVMAPMTRNFSPEGIPSEYAPEYYAKRARGGVALILTEGVEVSHPSSSGYPDVPNLTSSESKKMWARVVEEVHKCDSKIFCQLWHVGGIRKPGIDKNKDVPGYTPSGLVRANKKVAYEMTLDDIQEMISIYAEDAKICEELGFDGVEIHGAHGYLIDQFFWSDTNVRSDKYGGSLEKRTQFARDIIQACQNITTEDFSVGIRFSQWKQQDYDAKLALDENELKIFVDCLSESRPDFFHTSMRRFWEPEMNNSSLAALVKGMTDIPVIGVGSVGLDKDFIRLYAGDDKTKISDFDQLFDSFQAEEFDLIAIGRALLSDPDWVKKLEQNKMDTIVPFDKSFVENYV